MVAHRWAQNSVCASSKMIIIFSTVFVLASFLHSRPLYADGTAWDEGRKEGNEANKDMCKKKKKGGGKKERVPLKQRARACS